MGRIVSIVPAISLCVLAIWLQCIHLSLAEYAVDDAYIHFRIADHLATLGTPYFNPGEPVFATSSILWTCILAAIFKCAGSEIWAVAVLNGLITLANVYVWCRLGSQAVHRKVSFLTPLIAVLVLSVLIDSSVGLMETPLALLLIGSGFLAYSLGRPAGAFVLVTLSVFTRLEALVFLLGLLVLNLVCKKTGPVRSLLISILTALPLIVFCLYFFGGVVPHAVSAKQLIYQITSSDFVHLVMHGVFGGEILGQYKWVVVLFVLTVCLFVFYLLFTEKNVGLLLNIVRSSQLPVCIGICGLCVITAYAFKGVMLASWYMPLYELPLFFSVLIFSGLRRRLAVTILVSILVSPFVYQLSRNFVASFGQHQFYTDFSEGARVRKYLEVGRRLHSEYPNARLLTSEIGGLGYGFRGYLFDGVGLITPRALKYHPMRVPEERPSGMHGAIPVALITEVKPELVVSLDIFATQFLQSDEASNYEIRREPIFVDSDRSLVGDQNLWGATSLIVAVRRQGTEL